MEIYDHPTFRMACQQFDSVADRLQISEDERARLKYPKRSMTVAVPIRRDDGHVQVFSGYRVQHHLTLGPTKGGLRFHPDVALGEVAAPAMWERWEGGLTEVPYRGVQGLGNVGCVGGLSWARYGVRVIAASDAFGGVFNDKGLDLWKLDSHVNEKKPVAGFREAEPISNEQLLVTPCDILVPAALERQITAQNAGKIQCRILAEAANGPTTHEADAILEKRPETFLIPDVLCSAGRGV